METNHTESLDLQKIQMLRRNELKCRILNFQGRFLFDFTEDYLNSLPTDKLRHLLFAAQIVKN